jgi:uncharacterized protein (TIGR03067 family)
MRASLLASSLLVALLIQPDTQAGKGGKADVRLQGTWKLVSLKVMGGEMLEDGKLDGNELVLQIEGTKTIWKAGSESQTSSFTTDTSKQPNAIDFSKDKHTYRGIYQVRGDRLTLCAYCILGDADKLPDPPRPKEFSSDQELSALLVFKRVKR